jgi:Fe2+ transport system protein FeoA
MTKKHQGEHLSMTGNLKSLKPGRKGRVLKVHSQGEIKKRIIEMGLIPGSVVEVERIAPLGDPIDIKVKGYHLSLRKDEAERIEVEAL